MENISFANISGGHKSLALTWCHHGARPDTAKINLYFGEGKMEVMYLKASLYVKKELGFEI